MILQGIQVPQIITRGIRKRTIPIGDSSTTIKRGIRTRGYHNFRVIGLFYTSIVENSRPLSHSPPPQCVCSTALNSCCLRTCHTSSTCQHQKSSAQLSDSTRLPTYLPLFIPSKVPCLVTLIVTDLVLHGIRPLLPAGFA